MVIWFSLRWPLCITAMLLFPIVVAKRGLSVFIDKSFVRGKKSVSSFLWKEKKKWPQTWTGCGFSLQFQFNFVENTGLLERRSNRPDPEERPRNPADQDHTLRDYSWGTTAAGTAVRVSRPHLRNLREVAWLLFFDCLLSPVFFMGAVVVVQGTGRIHVAVIAGNRVRAVAQHPALGICQPSLQRGQKVGMDYGFPAEDLGSPGLSAGNGASTMWMWLC